MRDRLWFFAAYDRVSSTGDVSRVDGPDGSTDTDFRSTRRQSLLRQAHLEHLRRRRLSWPPCSPTRSTSSGAWAPIPGKDQRSIDSRSTAILTRRPRPGTPLAPGRNGFRPTRESAGGPCRPRDVPGLSPPRRQSHDGGRRDPVRRPPARTGRRELPTAPAPFRTCPISSPAALGSDRRSLDHNVSYRQQFRLDGTLDIGDPRDSGRRQLRVRRRDAVHVAYTGRQEVSNPERVRSDLLRALLPGREPRTTDRPGRRRDF